MSENHWHVHIERREDIKDWPSFERVKGQFATREEAEAQAARWENVRHVRGFQITDCGHGRTCKGYEDDGRGLAQQTEPDYQIENGEAVMRFLSEQTEPGPSPVSVFAGGYWLAASHESKAEETGQREVHMAAELVETVQAWAGRTLTRLEQYMALRGYREHVAGTVTVRTVHGYAVKIRDAIAEHDRHQSMNWYDRGAQLHWHKGSELIVYEEEEATEEAETDALLEACYSGPCERVRELMELIDDGGLHTLRETRSKLDKVSAMPEGPDREAAYRDLIDNDPEAVALAAQGAFASIASEQGAWAESIRRRSR